MRVALWADNSSAEILNTPKFKLDTCWEVVCTEKEKQNTSRMPPYRFPQQA
jgi:hypothetical protein